MAQRRERSPRQRSVNVLVPKSHIETLDAITETISESLAAFNTATPEEYEQQRKLANRLADRLLALAYAIRNTLGAQDKQKARISSGEARNLRETMEHVYRELKLIKQIMETKSRREQECIAAQLETVADDLETATC